MWDEERKETIEKWQKMGENGNFQIKHAHLELDGKWVNIFLQAPLSLRASENIQ